MKDHIKLHLLLTVAFGLSVAVCIVYFVAQNEPKVQTYRPDLMCLEKE